MIKPEYSLVKSKFYTQQEFIEKFGSRYQKALECALIIKDEKLFNQYKNEELITIKNNHGQEKSVSANLIIDLINNKYGMYNYLINNLNNQIGIAVKLCLFDKSGNLVDNIIITLAELKLFMNKIDKNRFKTYAFSPLISSITSIRKLEKTYSNVTREFVLDNEVISFSIPKLISYLMLDDEQFEEFIKKEESRKILYMLVDFVEKDRILDKYIFPENIHERYFNIKNNKIVDLETINSDIKSSDPDGIDNKIINEIKIEDSILDYTTKYMKQTYSKVEIAIHLFIRLNELIACSPYEYSGEISPIQAEEQNIEEQKSDYRYFKLIYAALLKRFNINYNVDKNTFIAGEFKIHVTDADINLRNMKIEDSINNLICINQMEITRTKFEELFNLVLDNILDREVKDERFILASERYEKKNIGKINSLNLTEEEKVSLLVEAILQSDLTTLDGIEYQKKVLNITDDDTISCVFVDTKEGNKTILTITREEQVYYYLLDKKSVKKIEYEELVKLFESGEYSYIADNTQTIIGIEGGTKKC